MQTVTISSDFCCHLKSQHDNQEFMTDFDVNMVFFITAYCTINTDFFFSLMRFENPFLLKITNPTNVAMLVQ